MSCHRDRQNLDQTSAEVPGACGGSFHGCAIAGDDDLPGCVSVCHGQAAERSAEGEEIVEAGVIQSDDRRHRARAALTRCLHLAASLADQAHRVGEGDHPGRDHCAVLTHRVTRHVRRSRGSHARRSPALPESGQERH